MWVIVANRGIELQRDIRISEIIGEPVTTEYVSKSANNRKFSSTLSILFALSFKTESGAHRFIEGFNSDLQKHNYYSRYNWIRDHVLSVRKLSKDEWNSICDFEMQLAKRRFDHKINKLNKKKYSYR